MGDVRKPAGPNTTAIHAGAHRDPATGAVSPPIYQTSSFAFADCRQGAARFAREEDGFIYTRMGNPTIARLEEAVSELEGGAGALATSSGMAALCTVAFALLNAGDHLVGTSSVYGPSRVVMERDFSRFGVTSDFVDTSDLDAIREVLRPETRLIFIETPANPTIVLSDIAAIARIAHDHGALLMVDNTFATPLLQRPLALGADLVMHSMTKFINGHTDVVAGMIVPGSQALLDRIRPVHSYLGACMDPHQAWLTLRGLRTIGMRVRTAQDNAARVAAFLEGHPKVQWVRYPGLPSHPQHALAQRQMDGAGSLVSFEVRGGVDGGSRLLDSVRLMTLAVSLGGIETLIQHPASMTHAAMSREHRLAAGISDGLVRLSIGCEDVDDLIADLEQAFEAV
ncbi:MAG TPA: PLP-dependent aspartate aminotransferase family protein [Thermoanaerobaculales bacterium]|nr:PLP-dependent aspartate aminotransferase family protein [Thermoanaerobaculales bacterium]HQN96684.1 PLP-dependent aspartate aminotransferase family protein [Thermoanaerobaculales bacterium]HQP43380.1 PLP-dependent aspartate aminotransferase family protein [Thermoanaerobaculales bacterium]